MSTIKQKKKQVLVVGARGGFGGAVLEELASRPGFSVKALVRPGGAPIAGAKTVTGDATSREDLLKATDGIDMIVYGLNVPYPRWHAELIPAAQVLADVAAERGARIVFPGNVYGLGPDYRAPLAEDAQRDAPTTKGALRNQVEDILHESTARGARLLLVRAGDFFGRSKNTWFSFMTKRALAGGPLLNPESRPIPHAWAYLPDLAATVAELLERESELTQDDVFHFAGHTTPPTQMVAACRDALGLPPRKIKSVPWMALRVAAVFSPLLRETLDMRYLWTEPVVLDDSKLRAFLGTVPHTELATAVGNALAPSKQTLAAAA